VLAGVHDLLEDCVAEGMNASGATFSGEQQVVRRCVFRDNGQLGFGANRAHDLLFTESLVENNNTKGFDRGWEAGGDKLVLCRDATLERSRFIRNRGNGLWFDVKDNRHWPAAGRTDPRVPNTGAAPELGGREEQPQAPALEQLRLRFQENVYFVAPGQGWFEWGVSWGRHKSYSTLSDFQADLAIDNGSRVTDPGFLDMLARDYRLSRQAMDELAQDYPRGPVPGVILGVQHQNSY